MHGFLLSYMFVSFYISIYTNPISKMQTHNKGNFTSHHLQVNIAVEYTGSNLRPSVELQLNDVIKRT